MRNRQSVWLIIYFVFFMNLGTEARMAMQSESDFDKANTFKDRAFELRTKGSFDEAIIQFDSAKFLYKRSDSLNLYFDSWEGQVWCSIYKGDFSEAESSSLEAIEETKQQNLQESESKFVRLLAIVYANRSDYEQAIEQFKKILEFRREKYGEEHRDYALALSDLSVTYTRMGKNGDALKHRLRATKIFEDLDEKSSLVTSYMNLGAIYFGLSEFQKMLEVSKKALDLSIEVNGLETPASANIIENIGVAYSNLGQKDKSKEYYLRTLRIREKTLGKEHWRLGNTYVNLANISERQDEFTQSVEYALKAYQIRKNALGDEHSRTIESTRELGVTYINNNQLKEAEYYLSEALHQFEKKYDSNHVDVAKTLMNLGVVKRLQGNYSLAETMLDRAINIFILISGNTGDLLARTYMDLSRVYSDQNDFDKALEFVNKAFIANKMAEKNADPLQPPNSSGYISLKYAFQLFVEKIDLLESSNQSPEIILEHINSILQFISSKQTKTNNGEDLLDYATKYHHYMGMGVKSAYKLYKEGKEKYKRTIYDYTERSKSNLLMNQLLHNQARDFSEMPDSLLLKESIILSQLEENISSQRSAENDSLLNFLKDEAFILNESYEELIEHFKTNYPKFFQLKYATPSIDITAFQKFLKSTKSASLSYLIHDTECYISYVTPNAHEIFLRDLGSDYAEEVAKLRKAISDPSSTDSDLLSQNFYELLIGFIDLDETIENILIVADGELNTIPFEILKNGDSFMMEFLNVRYANSISHLLSQKDDRSAGASEMVGFAPDFSAYSSDNGEDVVRGELAKLPGAIEEINTLASVFKSSTFLRQHATETNFKNHSKEYEMIHLATHAVIDDINPDNSRLVFDLADSSNQDGYLHAYEIYNLDLNAQLVTLSACNTGFGKIQKGEGVMSLSRAFAYAGVPATVVSLWPASDKSTPELMKYFYQNLKEGQTKDVALNNARKQYLATATGKARHPFYWGGFVLIGDNSPIEEERNLLIWILPITLIFIFIIATHRRRQKLKAQIVAE